MEIITGPESEIDGILLEWPKFDERTKTNQTHDEPFNDRVPLRERVKTIKLNQNLGDGTSRQQR